MVKKIEYNNNCDFSDNISDVLKKIKNKNIAFYVEGNISNLFSFLHTFDELKCRYNDNNYYLSYKYNIKDIYEKFIDLKNLYKLKHIDYVIVINYNDIYKNFNSFCKDVVGINDFNIKQKEYVNVKSDLIGISLYRSNYHLDYKLCNSIWSDCFKNGVIPMDITFDVNSIKFPVYGRMKVNVNGLNHLSYIKKNTSNVDNKVYKRMIYSNILLIDLINIIKSFKFFIGIDSDIIPVITYFLGKDRCMIIDENYSKEEFFKFIYDINITDVKNYLTKDKLKSLESI